jgi:predicted RNA-binding Zn-ribbon protein involved in translation (DUF1610 family)
MIALHNFECTSCKNVFEMHVPDINYFVECPKCGMSAKVTFDWGRCTSVQVFQPYWEDNIDLQPVYIESKQQLADECFKRDLKAARLMDGYKDYHKKGERYADQRREERRRNLAGPRPRAVD